MLNIIPVRAFNDNYIWLCHALGEDAAYAVDPGSAPEVIEALAQHGLKLAGILITHHHGDHTGGIPGLRSHVGHSLPIYGPAMEKIDGINHPLSGDGSVHLPHITTPVQLFKLPGHTLGHIAYLIEDNLFCGDTLFSGGCGRLFEGTPEQMYRSLTTLAKLPANTRVYCAHEYTQANLRFAQAVEPANEALHEHSQWVNLRRSAGLPTLPSNIGLERAINPFLRCHLPDVQATAANNAKADAPLVTVPGAEAETVQTFARLRRWKDNY
jgi:hydroxyacylglutathione hydrolase